MSKIIVPLHFAKLTSTPVNVDVGFKKFYLKGEWFKLYNGTSEIDVVLDRPLDNYVPIIGTITSSDTVLTAIEKLDYAISNFSANAAWGSITGTLAAQTDLINYLSTNYYPLSSNPAGYLTQQSVLEFPTFSSFPLIGASNTIYIAVDTDLAYYWDGVSYQIVTTSTSGITGFGTINTLPKFTPTGSQLGNSRFTDNGLTGRYGSASQYVTFLSGANTFLSLVRSQSNMTFTLGNPLTPLFQENTIASDNTVGTSFTTKGYLSLKVGATAATEGLRILSTGQIQLPVTPATGLTSDFLLLRDSTGNLKQIAYPTIPTGTVTSVGLTMPSAFSVTNSPITSSGDIAVTGAGLASQYVRGDGTLATLPTSASGGSSVNYYLNGSVASSVAGYQQMDNAAIVGGGTDFTLVGNGLIAQFLTNVGNPNRIQIPGGAWNFEMYFQVSSAGGNQKFYIELHKYDGSTFTLIASSSLVPEEITGGTAIDLYLTSIAVPTTTLLTTDRLAVRVYIVDNSGGRTITLHTEDNTLCEIITTFSGGVTSLNGLTANTQYLAVGTSGTDFNINSLVDTHTFNLPTASATNRGALSTTDWTAFNGKFTLPALTSGSVLFSNGTTIAQDNANFFWDDTNNRLGIGNATPQARIDVRAQGSLSTDITLRVRNNLDTSDLFSTNGLGQVRSLYTSDPGIGATIASFLFYAPAPIGLILRGYSSGVYSIQNQREINNSQLYDLSLQPLGAGVLIGTTISVPSSALTVESTTRGFLPPRMITTQKNAIATPATGLIVYDTNLLSLFQYNGTAWVAVGGGSGTVTSVAALTLGTTGTDLSSTVANGTTTPVITLNVPTASATNRGVLSTTDWTTFNGKQDALGYTPANIAGDTFTGNIDAPSMSLNGVNLESLMIAYAVALG